MRSTQGPTNLNDANFVLPKIPLCVDKFHKRIRCIRVKLRVVLGKNRDRGRPHSLRPLTPPGIRDRTGRCVERTISEFPWMSMFRIDARVPERAPHGVWVEAFYNRERRHSTLEYLSPVEYEKEKLNFALDHVYFFGENPEAHHQIRSQPRHLNTGFILKLSRTLKG